MPEAPQVVNVLVVRDVSQAEVDRIKAVDPERIRVTTIWRGIRDELLWAFPEGQVMRVERASGYLPPLPREETDRAIREGHVVYTGQVHPSDLYDRMPQVKWVHFTLAGVSSVGHSKFWRAPIDVTTTRGYSSALSVAEMAFAAGLMLAKGLHIGVKQTLDYAFDNKPYKPWLLKDKTTGVIGLGGIGMNLARLAKGAGMRAVGSRRSVTRRMPGEDGIDELFPPGAFHEMLAECDFVGICAPLTKETRGMFDAKAFGAMKPGAILMNIARGEIIDEPALAAALREGRVGGAYLDVFAGEEEGNLQPRDIVSQPNVVMTPRISARSDIPQVFSLELFCDNLRRFLDGKPLINVVDWDREY